MSFAEKVVVITGVGREGQIGEALASSFCEGGARVAAVDRSREHVVARVAALIDAGFDARAFPCDLTDPAQTTALSMDLEASYGQVDVFVHAAGGFAMSGPVAESDPAVWNRMFSINLTSAYLATRALIPLLRVGGGAILYFGSTAVIDGGQSAGMAAYAAAKSGVLTLMRTVAQEEEGHGIRSNAIAPVAVRTTANVESMGTNARYVSREEVAAVARFLCSDDAARITGEVIVMA
ncbi:MAG: SDR family NAD(P)-dependent oxidoreductase [Gemmatimonadaceae bacterium]|jgi:NAD(P)-dependent dehydrogenase (short-subunit alcohol dehydrogenase family)